MPPPPPSPSLSLLHKYVRSNLSSTDPKVVPLSSGRVKLCGFGGDAEVVDSVVSSLVLEAHIAVAPNLSFLALRGGSLFTNINNVDDNLIVISSTLPENHYREVFLIFDTIDRSLRMIPAVPRDLLTNRTYRVLAVPCPGDERSYSLVVPGKAPISLSDKGCAEWLDVLFISSTSPSSSTSSSSSTSPWQMMKRANLPKPQISDTFFADEVFLFSGRGYWADLLYGVMYCDCADVLSDGVDPVDFRFFTLPGSRMTSPLGRQAVTELRAFRTMGCVGGSIKFVSIDGFITRLDGRNMRHRNVRVWRLTEDLKWIIEDMLSMDDLWKMPGFFKNFANLQSLFHKPHSLAPMYPFLSTKEDRVIYFALGEFTQGHSWGSFPTTVHFLLRVDMSLWDVSYIHIPYSQTPAMQNYFGVNHAILSPPVALPGDGKAKVHGFQDKMKTAALSGDGKA
ncbi:hypothetical protein ACQ4PT_000644 [Festuca glaucescens]